MRNHDERRGHRHAAHDHFAEHGARHMHDGFGRDGSGREGFGREGFGPGGRGSDRGMGRGFDRGMGRGFGRGFGPGGPGFPGFPGGPGPFGPGSHHGPRGGRRRGNVRAAILALLTERSMHGYEMIQELDQRTGGVWRPSPGSIYPTLQLLEDEGLITSEEASGRKSYSLTEAGQAEAATAAENAPWAEFSAETISTGQDTRDAIGGILMALKQIGFERNQEQWARAVEVLSETKRKLYAILADSE